MARTDAARCCPTCISDAEQTMEKEVSSYFDEKSDLYAQARPHYPPEFIAWLAQQCRGHDRAWDAACGNGQAAVDLRAHFRCVEASDVSDAQIANAPPLEGVRYTVQSSERTEFADAAFDAVCVAQALHWFDLGKFWPEAARVLKPQGVFAAWGYGWPKLPAPLAGLLQQSLLNVIAPWWAPQNRLLWAGYQGIALPFPRIDAPRFSMHVDWDVDQLFMYLHSWSATRKCMEAQGDAFFRRSHALLRDAWGEPKTLRLPLDLHLIAGRKPG
jgi:SAM-dependent methyltransferase